MAATALTVKTISRDGLDLTAQGSSADGTNGNSIPSNTGNQFLWVGNAGASDCVVTIHFGATGTLDGQAPTDRTYPVTAAHNALLGPFPPQWYNDANGAVKFTFDQVTSVKVCACVLGT